MKRLPFLILLLAVAGGCVTRVETVEPPHPAAQSQPQFQPGPVQGKAITDDRVLIDSSLIHAISVVGIKTKMSPDGYLKIQVNIKNLENTTRQFSYRIDWTDENGLGLPLAAPPPTPWTLLPGETSFLAASSPVPGVKNFKVTFFNPGS